MVNADPASKGTEGNSRAGGAPPSDEQATSEHGRVAIVCFAEYRPRPAEVHKDQKSQLSDNLDVVKN